MSRPYTLDELLAIVVAREIHDYENVVLGVGVPMTAGALAKALFAPHATLMMESVYYGIRCGVIHPGYTDTPMVRALGEELINERIIPHTQLRRLIRPER